MTYDSRTRAQRNVDAVLILEIEGIGTVLVEERVAVAAALDLNVRPIAYWTFEGLLLGDDVIENIVNPGVHDLTDLSYGQATPTTGEVDEGILENTSAQVGAHAPNDAAFHLSAFTFMFWLKVPTLPSGDHFEVVSFNPRVSSLQWAGWQVYLSNASGVLRFMRGNNVNFGDRSLICETPTDVFADGLWHHVALRYGVTASLGEIWIDGVQVATGSGAIGYGSVVSDNARDFIFFPDMIAGAVADEPIFVGAGLDDASILNACNAGVAGRRVTYPEA